MKCNTSACKEEVRRNIESVKSSDGHVLQPNREMHEAFRVYFHDHFARCPDLPVQEFRSYLADFLRIREAEAASSEGLVTECKVKAGLSQQIARTRWFTQRSVLETPAHVCAYSDGYV